MRLWSLHPKYLDAKGLVALWRETLLAKHVLEGKTKGYTQHPQLNRFKACAKPLEAINFYLKQIWLEANNRGYNFNVSKFKAIETTNKLSVTNGQIAYEQQHLLKKLKIRDLKTYEKIKHLKTFELHPLFKIVKGDIEDWEVL